MEFRSLIPELDVQNFERSLEFYTRVLGFRVEYDRREEKFAFLSLGDAQLMIEEDNGNWLTAPREFPRGRGINFQICIDDLEPILKSLRASEFPLFREPDEKWRKTGDILTGQREFLIQDPDGFLLRFCQWLKK